MSKGNIRFGLSLEKKRAAPYFQCLGAGGHDGQMGFGLMLRVEDGRLAKILKKT